MLVVAGRVVARFHLATLAERPLAICACDDDSVIVACAGIIRRVWLDGRTATLATGSFTPKSVAIDATHVYVAADTLLVFAK